MSCTPRHRVASTSTAEVFGLPVRKLFPAGRLAVAYSLAPPDALVGNVLDYGCGDGEFIGTIGRTLSAMTYGCDISTDALERCRQKFGDRTRFFLVLGDDTPLPFPDDFFTLVFMCDVLEHIPEKAQATTVGEVARVLKPGGSLIVTVPNRGIQAWADPENIKFRWPQLHRTLWYWLHGCAEYERRYAYLASGFGNFTQGARWHLHFSDRELDSLLMRFQLQVVKTRFFNVMFPFIFLGLSLMERLEGKYRLGLRPAIVLLWRAWRLDSRLSIGRFSYNVAVRAVKFESETNATSATPVAE